MGYARPTDLTSALETLATGGWTPLAGGTDLYPATEAPELAGNILDLGGLAALRGIERRSGHWRIGALTTWTEIARAELPPAFNALQQAAREVGGVQIQNAGTVAGNLCNASPAADGVPALMILDADVELASATGTRVLRLEDFLTGPRATALTNHELLTAILVPDQAETGQSGFLKLGARKYLVISIAMAAVRIVAEADRVQTARIAVGACSPVARRLADIEQRLAGLPLRAMAGAVTDEDVARALAPIDDIRAPAGYRAAAAAELVRRLLARLGGAG